MAIAQMSGAGHYLIYINAARQFAHILKFDQPPGGHHASISLLATVLNVFELTLLTVCSRGGHHET